MILETKNKFFTAIKMHEKLIKNTIYIFALRGLQIVFGLITTYFVVRALSKDSFGEYHFILSCVGILTIFSLQGINGSIMQAIARGFPGSYRKSVPVAFFSSFIGSAILAILAFWYFYHSNIMLAYGFVVASALFPFAYGLMQWKSIHVGRENFGIFFIHNSLSMLLMYLLTIIFVFIYPDTLLVPLVFLLLIPSIQNIWQTISNYKKIPSDAPVEEGNVNYGIKTSFYSSFNIGAMHIDKLLLFFFLSPSALATYVAADRVAELFRNLTQDLSVVLAPKFAKQEHYTKKLDNHFKIFVLVYGALIILISFSILPWLITFLFSEKYISSIPYAQALLCTVVIGNMATLRFRFIRSKIDPESFRNITIITSLVRIVVSLIFIPWLGITGAVISVFLYRIFVTLTVNAVMKKNYPLNDTITEISNEKG